MSFNPIGGFGLNPFRNEDNVEKAEEAEEQIKRKVQNTAFDESPELADRGFLSKSDRKKVRGLSEGFRDTVKDVSERFGDVARVASPPAAVNRAIDASPFLPDANVEKSADFSERATEGFYQGAGEAANVNDAVLAADSAVKVAKSEEVRNNPQAAAATGAVIAGRTAQRGAEFAEKNPARAFGGAAGILGGGVVTGTASQKAIRSSIRGARKFETRVDPRIQRVDSNELIQDEVVQGNRIFPEFDRDPRNVTPESVRRQSRETISDRIRQRRDLADDEALTYFATQRRLGDEIKAEGEATRPGDPSGTIFQSPAGVSPYFATGQTAARTGQFKPTLIPSIDDFIPKKGRALETKAPIQRMPEVGDEARTGLDPGPESQFLQAEDTPEGVGFIRPRSGQRSSEAEVVFAQGSRFVKDPNAKKLVTDFEGNEIEVTPFRNVSADEARRMVNDPDSPVSSEDVFQTRREAELSLTSRRGRVDPDNPTAPVSVSQEVGGLDREIEVGSSDVRQLKSEATQITSTRGGIGEDVNQYVPDSLSSRPSRPSRVSRPRSSSSPSQPRSSSRSEPRNSSSSSNSSISRFTEDISSFTGRSTSTSDTPRSSSTPGGSSGSSLTNRTPGGSSGTGTGIGTGTGTGTPESDDDDDNDDEEEDEGGLFELNSIIDQAITSVDDLTSEDRETTVVVSDSSTSPEAVFNDGNGGGEDGFFDDILESDFGLESVGSVDVDSIDSVDVDDVASVDVDSVNSVDVDSIGNVDFDGVGDVDVDDFDCDINSKYF